MINETDRAELGEPQEVLDSIQEMKRAALKQAKPPRWFGAIMSPLAGAVVTLAVADLREYLGYIIALMSILIVCQAKSAYVSVKHLSGKQAGLVLAGIMLLPLFFLLVIAGQLLTKVIGVWGASLAAGTVFAIAVYMLSILERRQYNVKISKDKINE